MRPVGGPPEELEPPTEGGRGGRGLWAEDEPPGAPEGMGLLGRKAEGPEDEPEPEPKDEDEDDDDDDDEPAPGGLAKSRA